MAGDLGRDCRLGSGVGGVSFVVVDVVLVVLFVVLVLENILGGELDDLLRDVVDARGGLAGQVLHPGGRFRGDHRRTRRALGRSRFDGRRRSRGRLRRARFWSALVGGSCFGVLGGL